MPAQIGSQFRGTFELDAAPFDWGKDYKRPNLAPEDVIVYEMGVRSFTADSSSRVGAGKEGTYAGLMAKASRNSLLPLACTWPPIRMHAQLPTLVVAGSLRSSQR